jgi:beta-mannosidase
LLTVQPREGRLVLIAVNDQDTTWKDELRLERQTFAGVTLRADRLRLEVPERSVATIELAEALITPLDERAEVFMARAEDVRAFHLFREDSDLAYEANPLTARVETVLGGYQVDVLARSFARDVSILADRVAPDALVDDMLVSMLAGEVRSFFVKTQSSLDPAVLAGPLVLRSANNLCAPIVQP